MEPVKRGLMYIDAWVNQRGAKNTTIDYVAIHNFMTEAKARGLNLYWKKDARKMKVVNSATVPIREVVKRIILKLGTWNNHVNFVIVKMDDFEITLLSSGMSHIVNLMFAWVKWFSSSTIL